MFLNLMIYGFTLGLVGFLFYRNPQKTRKALKKAGNSMLKILPELLTILGVMGVGLALLSPQRVAALIGEDSGFFGLLISVLAGSAALMPGFVAFPSAALLLQNGASVLSMAGFVSALMMVGVITFPLESRLMGKKAAFWRNALAFCFSFLAAYGVHFAVGFFGKRGF